MSDFWIMTEGNDLLAVLPLYLEFHPLKLLKSLSLLQLLPVLPNLLLYFSLHCLFAGFPLIGFIHLLINSPGRKPIVHSNLLPPLVWILDLNPLLGNAMRLSQHLCKTLVKAVLFPSKLKRYWFRTNYYLPLGSLAAEPDEGKTSALPRPVPGWWQHAFHQCAKLLGVWCNACGSHKVSDFRIFICCNLLFLPWSIPQLGCVGWWEAVWGLLSPVLFLDSLGKILKSGPCQFIDSTTIYYKTWHSSSSFSTSAPSPLPPCSCSILIWKFLFPVLGNNRGSEERRTWGRRAQEEMALLIAPTSIKLLLHGFRVSV